MLSVHPSPPRFRLWRIRLLLGRTASAILLALPAACTKTPGPGESNASRTIEFEVNEGSWMTVDVAPDGKTLVFDLIGHLYSLPITGGKASALTSGDAWHRAPRFSPSGAEIAMVRDGDGGDEVWIMPAAGGDPRPITDHSKDRYSWVAGSPSWAPDGKAIVFGKSEYDFADNLPMWRVELASGATAVVETKPSLGARRSGVLSPDGRSFFFSERHEKIDMVTYRMTERTMLVRVDLTTQQRTILTDTLAGFHEFTPQLSDDGQWMSYVRRDSAGRSALRIQQLQATGETVEGSDRELLPLPDEDDPFRFDTSDERPAFSFTPDGQFVVLWAGGKIHKVAVANGADQVIPFTAAVSRPAAPLAQARTSLPEGPLEVRGIQWPRITADGKQLIFGAVGYIWIQDLPSGEPKRLTAAGPDLFEYMPALSPDGKTVAYTELARDGFGASPGRLMTISITGGEPRAVLSGKVGYFAPSWSSDGTKIAFLQDSGSHSGFGWVALDKRTPHIVAPVQQFQRETWGRLAYFSKDDKHLWYSWEYDPLRGRPDSTEMREVPLEGGPSRQMVMAGIDSRGMVPSPDGRNVLVMGVDDDLRVLPLPNDGTVARTDLYSTTLKRITSTGAEFVDWQGDSTFIYGFANRIYRYTIGGGEPELIHTVHLTVPRRQGSGVVAFTNARIITVSGDSGAGEVIEKGTLVVRGRRIASVGSSDKVAVPEGARVIDGTGLTLMPAIGDMHYHSQGGTNLLSKMIMENTGELGLRQSVAYGVTMGWHPGGPTRNGGGLAMAELREAGRIPGPRWINAPWGVNMTTYGDNSPQVMGSYEDALRVTRHRADQGATVLKEYMTRRRDHRKWFGNAAREVGVGIVSHVEGLDQSLSRAADGYTGFDHPSFAVPVYEDVRQFLARTGTIWTANINVTRSTDGGNADAQRACVREVIHRWPDELAKWDYHYPKRKLDTLPPAMAFEKTRLGRTAKAAAYLMAGDVKIGISAHNPPALFTHCDMWYYQQAGAPRADIIRAATMIGAEKMGLAKELGSLVAGKVADILVLKGNPLDDIINTVSQVYVVADGVVYDPRPGANQVVRR